MDMRVLTVRIPADMYLALQEYATANNITIAELTRVLLSNHLGMEKPEMIHGGKRAGSGRRKKTDTEK